MILFSSTETAIRWAYALYDAVLGPFDGSGGIEMRFLAQKVFHVFLFVILSWLFSAFPVAGRARRILICALGCVTVGILSEGLQLLVSSREATLTDAMINGLSGALSAFFWVR